MLIVKGMLVSVGIHFSIIGLVLVLSRFIGGFEHISMGLFFFLVPLGMLVTSIPIAPAGLGTGHAAFLGLFSLLGASRGADLFSAYVAFQILVNLSGGLVYLKRKEPMPALVPTE
jgi:uncharacterized membrane protein YbhN (UPF0104 family)